MSDTTGEVWDKATGEWKRLPDMAREGLELESFRQGFIHGHVIGGEDADKDMVDALQELWRYYERKFEQAKAAGSPMASGAWWDAIVELRKIPGVR